MYTITSLQKHSRLSYYWMSRSKGQRSNVSRLVAPTVQTESRGRRKCAEIDMRPPPPPPVARGQRASRQSAQPVSRGGEFNERHVRYTCMHACVCVLCNGLRERDKCQHRCSSTIAHSPSGISAVVRVFGNSTSSSVAWVYLGVDFACATIPNKVTWEHKPTPLSRINRLII